MIIGTHDYIFGDSQALESFPMSYARMAHLMLVHEVSLVKYRSINAQKLMPNDMKLQ